MPAAPIALGITVMPEFLQVECVEPVLDRIAGLAGVAALERVDKNGSLGQFGDPRLCGHADRGPRPRLSRGPSDADWLGHGLHWVERVTRVK